VFGGSLLRCFRLLLPLLPFGCLLLHARLLLGCWTLGCCSAAARCSRLLAAAAAATSRTQ
jgi:hypothetical protein